MQPEKARDPALAEWLRASGADVATVVAYGKILPPVSDEGLGLANETLTWDARLPRVTLGQIWLHFTHRLGAVAVTTSASLLVAQIYQAFDSSFGVDPLLAKNALWFFGHPVVLEFKALNKREAPGFMKAIVPSVTAKPSERAKRMSPVNCAEVGDGHVT